MLHFLFWMCLIKQDKRFASAYFINDQFKFLYESFVIWLEGI